MAKNSSKDLKRNISISKIMELLKTNKKEINEEVIKKKDKRKRNLEMHQLKTKLLVFVKLSLPKGFVSFVVLFSCIGDKC